MKKFLSIVGLFVGLAFIVVGILTMSGTFGGWTSSPGSAPYYYDSGYASFGADYYTYSVNNSAEAASAARTAAYNLDHIAEFFLNFFGITSILFGLMVISGFGIVLSSCTKKDKCTMVDATSNCVPDANPIENEPVTQD